MCTINYNTLQLQITETPWAFACMQAAGPGPASTGSSCEPQLTFKQWQQVLLRIAQQHFPSLQPEEGLERLVGSQGGRSWGQAEELQRSCLLCTVQCYVAVTLLLQTDGAVAC